jgi:hypothetical protein
VDPLVRESDAAYSVFRHKSSSESDSVNVPQVSSVPPQSDRAALILRNGSTFRLKAPIKMRSVAAIEATYRLASAGPQGSTVTVRSAADGTVPWNPRSECVASWRSGGKRLLWLQGLSIEPSRAPA